MNSAAHWEVDHLILLFAREQWRKVAMLISLVLGECKLRGIHADAYAVAGRIRALIEDGQLEIQGNPLMWRLSEVRLPE